MDTRYTSLRVHLAIIAATDGLGLFVGLLSLIHVIYARTEEDA